jgi:hypothetical protein
MLTLDLAAKNGTLPPVGNISIPTRNVWPNGAWTSVVASQTATHFPRQQLAGLAASYKLLERLQEFSGRELDSWTSLYAMVGPGRRLDPASEAELRKALSHARADARTIASLSLQMIISVKSHHLVFDRVDLERLADAERQPSLSEGICKPIGAVPPSYGQSYLNPIIATLDEAAKKLPNFSEDAR